MTIKELIEELRRYPEDSIVVIDDGEDGIPIGTTFVIYPEEAEARIAVSA